MNVTETMTSPPQPPHPPPPGQPPLRRSSTDRVLAGVCGGLGQRYQIDPAVLRVGFVIGILAGGLGILGYVALWLLLPKDQEFVVGSLTRSLWRLIVGSLTAALGAFAFVSWLSSLAGISGVVVGAFLVGLGVWVYFRNRDTATTPAGGSAPIANAPGTIGDTLTPGSDRPMAASPPQYPVPPPPGFAYGGTGGVPHQTIASAPPPPPREPRSWLGVIVLLAAVMAAGFAGILMGAGVVTPSATLLVAAVLAVLAGGLVVAARYGRARWLAVPATFLALCLPLVNLAEQYVPEAQSALEQGVGERTWIPQEPGQIYTLGLGEGTLDLMPWASNPKAVPPKKGDEVTAEIELGALQVVVPSTWDVTLTAAVRKGEIFIDGQAEGSAPGKATVRRTLRATEKPLGAIALDLGVTTGEIRVIRRDPPSATTPRQQTPQDPTARSEAARSSARPSEGPRQQSTSDRTKEQSR